jgi:predicted ester cyclase
MAESENITLVHRWFEEVWNQRRLTTIDELLTPDARCFDMTAPDSMIVGPAAFRAAADQMHEAFGEMKLTVEDIFASGDRVAVRLTGRLKHTGALGPLAATNREVTVPIMCMLRFRDGKLCEGWNNWDIGAVLRTAEAPTHQRSLF